MHEIKALGSYAIAVPLSFLYRLADFLGVPKFLGILLQLPLVVQGKSGVKTAIRQNAAKSLTIANTRVTIAGLEVGLITTNPPTVMLTRFDETAVLDTRVPTLYLEIEGKVEIFHLHTLADYKGIPLGWSSLGRLAHYCPGLHAPKLWISVPTFQRFPVKEIFFRMNGGVRKDEQSGEEFE